MKSLYCLCDDCTAKWFCPSPPPCCPRCGGRHFDMTRARRPWVRTRISDACESNTKSSRRRTIVPTSSRRHVATASAQEFARVLT